MVTPSLEPSRNHGFNGKVGPNIHFALGQRVPVNHESGRKGNVGFSVLWKARLESLKTHQVYPTRKENEIETCSKKTYTCFFGQTDTHLTLQCAGKKIWVFPPPSWSCQRVGRWAQGVSWSQRLAIKKSFGIFAVKFHHSPTWFGLNLCPLPTVKLTASNC